MNESLSYAKSGVNIDAGNELVQRIKPYAKSTQRKEVLTGLGGFGALFELPFDRYKHPVLVSGTDGVGTKLKLALEFNLHDTIGIDLVAMCVNDIVVTGAEPLFFLDYYATGKLNLDTAESVIKGIADGCKISGCALVGGETAEMPGMYSDNDYDLAGFCVGIVEKTKLISGKNIQSGDVLIALGSSGIHSNGYSLVRKVLEHAKVNFNLDLENEKIGSQTLKEALLTPTRIYVQTVLNLLKDFEIKGIAHITGGGITENLPRVLPEFIDAEIDLSSFSLPPIFNFLKDKGNITLPEMLKTFNCGVGMILTVSKDIAESAVQKAQDLGENAWIIGHTISSNRANPQVIYQQ